MVATALGVETTQTDHSVLIARRISIGMPTVYAKTVNATQLVSLYVVQDAVFYFNVNWQ